MAYYGNGSGRSGPGHNHVPPGSTRSGGSKQQHGPPAGAITNHNYAGPPQYYFDPDDENASLARPDPIGFQRSGYYARGGGGDPRDSYHDYRRRERDEVDYRRYNRDIGMPYEFMEGPRHGSFNVGRSHYGGGPTIHHSTLRQQEMVDYVHELRVRDPIVYRKWYESYLKNPKNPPPLPGFHAPGSSGGSVANFSNSYSHHMLPGRNSSASHYDSKRPGSGRSSVTDDFYPQGYPGNSNAPSVNTEIETQSLPYDAYNFIPIRDDISYKETPPERMTPQKFPSSHCIGIISPQGQLLTIKSGATTIEIRSLGSMFSHLNEYQQIAEFPGPLIRSKVHKHTVIQFCQKKIKEARSNESQIDKDSFILLWEFLILLLRQNGSIVGSDVAELLLKKEGVVEILPNKENDTQEEHNEETDDQSDSVTAPVQAHPLEKHTTEAQNLKMFCDYLLYGHTKDALEFAMKNNLWGHALILAFKMNEKEYRNVMTRFISGMSLNHPLVTLYDVMGGKSPPAVTNCCEESFGDWKPHLAMILSNSGWKPEFETKSIITLGDTLGNKNHIYGSQFCYLMANLEFSSESKLGPLLGLAPGGGNIIEATQMTEIYEFARTLADPNYFNGPSFFQYKFDYVKLLVDFGFSREAYSYCEELAKLIPKRDKETTDTLKWSILQVAERLKSFDEASEDPSWIHDFKKCLKLDADEQQYLGEKNVEEDSNKYTSDPSQFQPVVADAVVADQNYSTNLNDNQSSAQNPKSTVGQYYQPTPDINPPVVENNGPYYPQYPNDIRSTTVPDQGGQQHYPTNPINPPEFQQAPDLYNGASSEYYPQNQNIEESQPMSVVTNNGPMYPPYPSSNTQQPGKKRVRFEDEDPDDETRNQHEQVESRLAIDKHNKNVISPQSFASSSFTPEHTSQELALISREVDKESYIATNPVLFKSTFPIDEPFSKLSSLTNTNKNILLKPKTYPTDKECCDVQKPCNEHDNFQHFIGGSSTSQLSLNAGPNFKSENKNDQNMPMQMNPYPPAPKPGLSNLSSGNEAKSINKTDKKSESNKSDGKQNKEPAKSSWLGSLIPSFKAKNQMKLPDDKDPAIVWDEANKRWINKHGDTDDDSGPKGPPPSDFELKGNMNNNNNTYPPMRTNSVPNFQLSNASSNQGQQYSTGPTSMSNANTNGLMNPQGDNRLNQNHNQAQSNPGGTQPPQTMNMYSLPKGRKLRSSYVDVFKPESGTTISGSGPNPNRPAPAPFVPPMFVPGPPPPESINDQPSFFTPPGGGFQQQQHQQQQDNNQGGVALQ